MKRYNKDDSILQAVATLIGCKANTGMANRFNDMSEKGLLVGCKTNGDFGFQFLLYSLDKMVNQSK